MLSPPDGEALAAGVQPVNLFLLVRPAQAGLLILGGQRRSGLAAGQGETVQLAISQDQGLLGDPVQQASVVGNQHEGAAPAQQKLLEPEQGGQVQVVAGLIEQQQVGLTQQSAPYLQPAVLAAAQGTDRQRGLGFQLQLGQQLVHLPLGGGVVAQGIQQHGAGAEGGKPGGQLLGHELAAAGSGLHDPTGLGRALARQQRQQCALAAAVGANQAEAVARTDAEFEVVK